MTQPCSVCGTKGEVWGEDEQGHETLLTCYLCLGKGFVEVVPVTEKRDPVLWRPIK